MELEQVGNDVGVDEDERALRFRQSRKVCEEIIFGLLQKVQTEHHHIVLGIRVGRG